ncbi:tellurite resistance TerB family protein [Wenzhouxiangella sp. EGI_FJ10409]|uniref:tellurite resistance TerB family protein n=1 Tax=Wenzhouxiangella sp. EGI_FJ10409 TaxID=3243767 RepID=UPI0035D6556E
MEVLIVIGVVWFIWWAIGEALTNRGREAQGSAPSGSMSKLEARCRKESFGQGDAQFDALAVELRGLFPVNTNTRTKLIISVFWEDENQELLPVLSALEDFQEEETIAYQNGSELPVLKPGYGFGNWVQAGVVIPDLLIAPYGGRQRIKIFLRLMDLGKPFDIRLGRHSEASNAATLWSQVLNREVALSQKGYIEAKESQDKAVELSAKLAVAVSVSDGSVDPKESEVVKRWIKKHLESFEGDDRESRKKTLNEALSDTLRDAKVGQLQIGEICKELRALELQGAKYEAIELCHDVMAADGVVDKDEIKVLDQISKALELDEKKVEAIRDKRINTLSVENSATESRAHILGIKDGWSKSEIKAHLRKEFTKWNNRLNTLPKGPKRDRAQEMLKLIGDERKKYE